jgi:uncharacterized membrane protein
MDPLDCVVGEVFGVEGVLVSDVVETAELFSETTLGSFGVIVVVQDQTLFERANAN